MIVLCDLHLWNGHSSDIIGSADYRQEQPMKIVGKVQYNIEIIKTRRSAI